MKKLTLVASIVLFWSCSSGSEDETVIGNWDAKWTTLPESFPGVEGVDFEMDGSVKFTRDSITISAYGYPGCIFSEDTLIHTLKWQISQDSLKLVNADNIHGMTYIIKELSESNMELVMMDDIYLSLTR